MMTAKNNIGKQATNAIAEQIPYKSAIFPNIGVAEPPMGIAHRV